MYRAQADALEIEAMAKRRLADEYDAAQARGEIRGLGGDHGNQYTGGKVPVKNSATHYEIGLTKGDVYDARRTRDAIEAHPEIISTSLDAIISRGHEPTKAALGREINSRLSSFSGDNEWYTPARYVEMARSDWPVFFAVSEVNASANLAFASPLPISALAAFAPFAFALPCRAS